MNRSLATECRRLFRRLVAIRSVAWLRDRVRLRTRLRSLMRRLTARGAILQARSGPDWRTGIGALELPALGAQLSTHAILVSGWAYVPGEMLSEVEVYINGRSRGLARIGIQREDIDILDHSVGALLSGFEMLTDVDTMDGHNEGEIVRVLVIARTLTGAVFVVAERDFEALQPPEVNEAEALAPDVSPLEGANATPITVNRSERSGQILVVTHDLNLGGAQLWLSEMLARSGAGSAYGCTVRADTDGPLRSEFEKLGIAVEIAGRPPVTRWHDYRIELERLQARVRDGSFNSVLVNTFGCFIGADAARRAGVPAVWAIHESWTPPMFWTAAYGVRGIDPRVADSALSALRATPAVVFEADATLALYEPWTNPGAGMVIPYGVDHRATDAYCQRVDRAEARARLGITEGDRVLLVMGTVERRKAQTLLVQAFAEIAAEFAEARLAFVGDTATPYSGALKKAVRRLNLTSRVQIHPVTSDAFLWYLASDLLVCASDVESLPRSVLDAMSFGTPILATRVFGLPELLEDGVTGFLYAPNSLSAAIGALRRVLALPQQRLVEVGLAGKELVRRDYDSSGYAKEIRTLMRKLASGSCSACEPFGGSD